MSKHPEDIGAAVEDLANKMARNSPLADQTERELRAMCNQQGLAEEHYVQEARKEAQKKKK